jgi:hypothetical protein
MEDVGIYYNIWPILRPFCIFYDHLLYFVVILNILWPFCIFYDRFLYFVVIWDICSRFGMLYQEKSGNPAMYSSIPYTEDGIRQKTIPTCLNIQLDYVLQNHGPTYKKKTILTYRVARWHICMFSNQKCKFG